MLMAMQTVYMGDTVPVDVESLEVRHIDNIEGGEIVVKQF